MLNAARNFFNGFVFGLTQIVPGVSGGTIALIMGFYFELIETINHFFKDLRKNLKFLLPLAFGMAAGIIIFSSIIDFLLTNYSFPAMLFFIGLISGIIPHVFFKVRDSGQKLNALDIILVITPFIILLLLSFLHGENTANPAEIIGYISLPFMIFIFFAGVLSAAALIIPGLSGSFILLLLGIYPLAVYSAASLRFLLTDITNLTLFLDICRVLVPLAIGMITGIILTAKLIEKLLQKYYRQVYLIMLGLLSGSVLVLFFSPIVYQSGISAPVIIIGIAAFFIGAVLSFIIGKKRF